MWPFKSKKDIEEARMYRETKDKEDLDKLNSRSTSILKVTTTCGHLFLVPVTTKGYREWNWDDGLDPLWACYPSTDLHELGLKEKHQTIISKGIIVEGILSFGPHMIASVETEGETLHWQAEEGDEGYLSELPHGH